MDPSDTHEEVSPRGAEGALELAPLPTELNFDDDDVLVGDSGIGHGSGVQQLPKGPGALDDVGLFAEGRKPAAQDALMTDAASHGDKSSDDLAILQSSSAPVSATLRPRVASSSAANAHPGSSVDSESILMTDKKQEGAGQPLAPLATGDDVIIAVAADALLAAESANAVDPGQTSAHMDSSAQAAANADTMDIDEAAAKATQSGPEPIAAGASGAPASRGQGDESGAATLLEGDRGEADAAEIASGTSSPLSSLPDLPDSLPGSPMFGAALQSVHPPQLLLSPEANLGRLFEHPNMAAESSAQAVARAKKQAGGTKRKAESQSGSKKKVVKASLPATGKATKKANGTGKGNGYRQEDAIDIQSDVASADDGDGDYRPGEGSKGKGKGKGKRSIMRRGPKKKIEEYFGQRTLRLPSSEDEPEDDEPIEEKPPFSAAREPRRKADLLQTTKGAEASGSGTPSEEPEPIEALKRTTRSPTPLRSVAETNLKDESTAEKGTPVEADSRRVVTRGGGSSASATLSSIKPPERVQGAKLKTYTDAQIKEALRGRTTEKQLSTCQRPRYAKWGKCTQCVAKNGGDTCRFRDFRVFPIDPRTTDIIGPGYFKPAKLSEDMTPLPTEFNVPFDERHILRTERTVAPILLPLITRELRHIVKNKAIKREVDAAKHRSVCDFCQSTIFAGYFFCRLCGKDYCLSCERFFSDDADNMDSSPWHIFAAARPRLMHCSARAGKASGVTPLEPGPRTYGDDPSRADVEAGERANAPEAPSTTHQDGFLTGPSIPPAPFLDAARGLKRKADGSPAPGSETDSAVPVNEAEATSPADGRAPGKTRVKKGQKGGSHLKGKTKMIKWHFRPDLQPVSRFDEEEIRAHWLNLARYGVRGDEADWTALFGLGDVESTDAESKEVSPLGGMSDQPVSTEGAARSDSSPASGPQLSTNSTGKNGAALNIGSDTEKQADGVQGLIAGIASLRKHLEELAAKTQTEQDTQRIDAIRDAVQGEPNRPASSVVEPAMLYTHRTHSTAPLPPDPAELHAESHPFMRIHVDQLDNAAFEGVWSRGEPLVVDGIDQRLKEKWDPDGMTDKFGDEACGVTDCDTNVAWLSTVRDFFEGFKDREGRPKQILKLKDWPATEDFNTTHPRLYNDFCDALPVPDYTRREGALNLYAHFPPGSSRPDIGPKMYNAYAAREGKGGHGSTRLHMDVADAINVMLYASPLDILPGKGSAKAKEEVKREGAEHGEVVDLTGEGQTAFEQGTPNVANGEMLVEAPNGGTGVPSSIDSGAVTTEPKEDPAYSRAASLPADPAKTAFRETPPTTPEQPGCAVWDIFRAEDADKIRAFLSRKFDSKHVFVDPIHAQVFFLDAAMRRELWEKHGVVSHRIYQYPGQAVFIPAGCAHQVCNLADCIKIALDFVSPHNVRRCQQLTQDFRNENFVKAWKEDVLQLYNILWFAWISSRETRERRAKEQEERTRQRAQHLKDVEDAQKGSAAGRTAVSSIREEPTPSTPVPRDGTPVVTAEPEANGEAARGTAEPSGTRIADDPSSDGRGLEGEERGIEKEQDELVHRLLDAALAAPDAPPPPEARAPSAATGSRWAEAKAASMAAAAPILARTIKKANGAAGRTASANAALPASVNNETAVTQRSASASAQAASMDEATIGEGQRGSESHKDADPAADHAEREMSAVREDGDTQVTSRLDGGEDVVMAE